MDGRNIHGGSRLLSWWIPRFNPSICNVWVCGLKQPDAISRDLEEKGIRICYLGRGRFSPAILSDLVDMIQSEKVDILHLHGYAASNFGRLAGWLTGKPAIVHEHAYFRHIPPYQVIADMILAPLTTKGLSNCKAVKEFMVQGRRIKSEKIEVLYLGIPFGEFETPCPELRADERRKLGIPPDVPVITCVGRLSSEKGQVDLIRAVPEVLHEFSEARFLIVGDGPDRMLLEKATEEIGIKKNVIFTGYRKDVSILMALSDIKVIPSLFEATTLTVFEAMTLGKAIVATLVGGLGEVLTDKETALLVPPQKPCQLALSIVYLLRHPNERCRLGTNALRTSRRYNVTASVQRLEEIYQEIAR